MGNRYPGPATEEPDLVGVVDEEWDPGEMRRQHSFSTLSYFYRQGNNSTSVDLYDRSILEFDRANGIVIDEKISTKGSMSYNDSRIIGK